MGINSTYANILLTEKLRRDFSGDVLQLGRQDIHFTMKEFVSISKKHEILLSKLDKVELSGNSAYRSQDYINDKTFFLSLGFSVVHSMDVSTYEKANIIWDLNKPVPVELHNKYDVIVDGGTIEHIFHIPNVFKNIYNMLKVGGRVIHFAPSASLFCIDHGYYMFSPILFYDYYSTNGYEIEKKYVSLFDMLDNKVRDVYEYNSKMRRKLHHKNKDSAEVVIIATKTEHATCDKIPQQGVNPSVGQDWSKDILPTFKF